MILCENEIDLTREVETNDGEELAKKEELIFLNTAQGQMKILKKCFFLL